MLKFEGLHSIPSSLLKEDKPLPVVRIAEQNDRTEKLTKDLFDFRHLMRQTLNKSSHFNHHSYPKLIVKKKQPEHVVAPV